MGLDRLGGRDAEPLNEVYYLARRRGLYEWLDRALLGIVSSSTVVPSESLARSLFQRHSLSRPERLVMVAMLSPITTFLLFAFHLLRLGHAQSLSACPANAKIFTADDGNVYEHCPYSDYQSTTAQLTPDIYTAADCAQLCHKNGCQQAVWDSFQFFCHMKTGQGPWVTSAKFDTVRFLKKGNQPVAGLSACPTNASTYEASSGAIFEICPNSDYSGNSLTVNWNIPDQTSCVQMCANTAGCTLGIWDKVAKACHVKSTAVTWVSRSTTFDAIRMIAPPAQQPQPNGLSACPSTVTQWTLDDGSLYEVCPNSDYQGTSYNIIGNVLSDWDCLRLCNADTSCTLSVFDYKSFYCHLKATSVTWATNNGQYNTARLVQRGSRSGVSYQGLGKWTAPRVVPANPVGAYIVPRTQRVLGFSSWGDDNFYGATGVTQFSDYNWWTGDVSPRTISNTGHDMFCPGMSMQADGRLNVNGGSDAGKTSIYDPSANNFMSGANLNIPRGYQTSCATDTGKVFTIGGSYTGGIGGKTGEIYDPASNTWTVLKGTNVTAALTTYDGEGEWRTDNHMWLWAWKQGSVFQAGPSKTQHWFGTTGSGSTVLSGTRDSANDAMCGLNVMYDAVAGKIWSAGGAQSYTNSPGLTTAHITTIGTPFQPATVKQVAPLLRPRAFANVVVLPDGTLLVTGGQSVAKVFHDDASQFVADLYNPATNTWRALSSAKVPRNYHSTALLLADGTVFTGGGGLCWTGQGASDAGCDRTAEHPSVEIFSPPYLFNSDGTLASRPYINSVSSTSDGSGNTAKAGDSLKVVMGDSSKSTTFSLIRVGSSTHTINTDQRRVPLTGSQSSATWTFKLPSDYGVLIPGYYYLFAVNGNGVPSYASTVQVIR